MILNSRKVGCQYDYLIHWKDLPDSENSWTPLTEISSSLNHHLEQFHRHNLLDLTHLVSKLPTLLQLQHQFLFLQLQLSTILLELQLHLQNLGFKIMNHLPIQLLNQDVTFTKIKRTLKREVM